MTDYLWTPPQPRGIGRKGIKFHYFGDISLAISFMQGNHRFSISLTKLGLAKLYNSIQKWRKRPNKAVGQILFAWYVELPEKRKYKVEVVMEKQRFGKIGLAFLKTRDNWRSRLFGLNEQELIWFVKCLESALNLWPEKDFVRGVYCPWLFGMMRHTQFRFMGDKLEIYCENEAESSAPVPSRPTVARITKERAIVLRNAINDWLAGIQQPKDNLGLVHIAPREENYDRYSGSADLWSHQKRSVSLMIHGGIDLEGSNYRHAMCNIGKKGMRWLRNMLSLAIDNWPEGKRILILHNQFNHWNPSKACTTLKSIDFVAEEFGKYKIEDLARKIDDFKPNCIAISLDLWQLLKVCPGPTTSPEYKQWFDETKDEARKVGWLEFCRLIKEQHPELVGKIVIYSSNVPEDSEEVKFAGNELVAATIQYSDNYWSNNNGVPELVDAILKL